MEYVFNETETSSEDGARMEQRTKKKHKHHEEIMGEFKNIKVPIFNGEIEAREEAGDWLSGMKKYFQIYNYSIELKERTIVYNLTEKEDIS